MLFKKRIQHQGQYSEARLITDIITSDKRLWIWLQSRGYNLTSSSGAVLASDALKNHADGTSELMKRR